MTREGKAKEAINRMKVLVKLQEERDAALAQVKSLESKCAALEEELTEAKHLSDLHMARCKSDMETMARLEREVDSLRSSSAKEEERMRGSVWD